MDEICNSYRNKDTYSFARTYTKLEWLNEKYVVNYNTYCLEYDM